VVNAMNDVDPPDTSDVEELKRELAAMNAKLDQLLTREELRSTADR
jgi:hypothetical protein